MQKWLLECPSCRGELAVGADELLCLSCRGRYPIVNGIPVLFAPGDDPTVEPGRIRIKNPAEAAVTVAEMNAIDRGFIPGPRAYYLVYLAAAAVALGWRSAFLAPFVLLLAVDWIYFRSRRGRALKRYERNPLRLHSAGDWRIVDSAYEREGKTQPTMSDWVGLGGGRGALGAGTAIADDERYHDILRVYRSLGDQAEVIADIGANDGRACWEFGIGAGRLLVGIDVSRLLLEEFSSKLPGMTAIQADGARLPIRSGTVDFLFCTETLEHMTDPSAAMAEFARVLKPGGRMMIQSPNAHRLRNLNIFHILTLVLSLLNDKMLQRKIVHENTWLNACTYHWDFSLQHYKRMLRGTGCRVVETRSSSFFFPLFLLRGRVELYRRKERILSSIPVVKYFGGDLVLVAEKTGEPVSLRMNPESEE